MRVRYLSGTTFYFLGRQAATASRIAAIACGRGKLFRHARATRRAGIGRANGTGTTSVLWYLGVSASRGSTETPRPDATMLRTVSSELPRVTRESARFSSGHASSTCSRKQWPTSSRIGFSAASSSTCIDLRRAHLWPRGTTTWNGSSYRNSVTMPGGANGSAMIAASMRPLFSADFEMLGQVLLDLERHLRRALVQRRNQVRQQVRRDRVDHAEPQRPGELVASRLRELLDPRRLLQHLLRLLDDALADRRHRDLALAALEEARAQLLLELLDRDRKRGLAHEAALRGAAEAALVRDGDDVAKLAQRHRLGVLPLLPEERREILGELRMLETEVDGRLEIAELAAAVVAAALERVGEHALVGEQPRDAVGQLDFAAGAGGHRAQVIEDARRQHVAADDRQRRRRRSRLGLLDDPRDRRHTTADGPGLDDAPAADVVRRHRHDADHRAILALRNLGHLLHHRHFARRSGRRRAARRTARRRPPARRTAPRGRVRAPPICRM